MAGTSFAVALREYAANFVTVLVFLLLGAAVFVFSLYDNTFLGSGTVFLEYNLFASQPLVALVQLALVVLFLAFFSLFLVVMIFAVRQHLAKVKFSAYLKENVPRFTAEMFEYWLVFAIVSFLVGWIGFSLGLHPVLAALVLFVLSALLFFVPQSIVVDEVSWPTAVKQSVELVRRDFRSFLKAFVVGLVLLLLVPLVELFFDQFALSGRFVSLLFVLVFVLPFIEVLKTVVFMSKFDLVRNTQP